VFSAVFTPVSTHLCSAHHNWWHFFFFFSWIHAWQLAATALLCLGGGPQKTSAMTIFLSQCLYQWWALVWVTKVPG
jgi:hypothetical protein